MYVSIQEGLACWKSQYSVNSYYHWLWVTSLILCCLHVFEDWTDKGLVLFFGGGIKKLWASVYSYFKCLKKMFTAFEKWIPRTSSQVCGFEGLELFVSLSVTMCYRWDWCLHLGTESKVEIDCWPSDRTLKGCHGLWYGGFSGPKTVVSCDFWSLTSLGYGECLLKEWYLRGLNSHQELTPHHLCDFRQLPNFSGPWNIGRINKIMYVECLAHSKTEKC